MLDPENPFVIKVPEGATHIDLGPVLRPLIFKLLNGGLTDPKKIERYVLEGSWDLTYREILPKINGAMLVEYLQSNGWSQTDQNNTCLSFYRDYEAKQAAWDRRGAPIRVHMEHERAQHLLHRHHEVVQRIAEHERIPLYAAAHKVIAQANILDRIVAELGD